MARSLAKMGPSGNLQGKEKNCIFISLAGIFSLEAKKLKIPQRALNFFLLNFAKVE